MENPGALMTACPVNHLVAAAAHLKTGGGFCEEGAKNGFSHPGGGVVLVPVQRDSTKELVSFVCFLGLTKHPLACLSSGG